MSDFKVADITNRTPSPIPIMLQQCQSQLCFRDSGTTGNTVVIYFILFYFFHAELILNSQKSSKYGIESSNMPFAQLPCTVTSCITMVKWSSEPWYTIVLAERQILFGISVFPLMSFICCIWWSRLLTLLQSGTSSVPPCLFWLLKGSSQGFETVVCLRTVVQSS